MMMLLGLQVRKSQTFKKLRLTVITLDMEPLKFLFINKQIKINLKLYTEIMDCKYLQVELKSKSKELIGLLCKFIC